jgi:hypothetical protein
LCALAYLSRASLLLASAQPKDAEIVRGVVG